MKLIVEWMQVHYLGNEGRGTVWEEIIINCPPHIQMLAMSATVANPDDLGSWITKVVSPPHLCHHSSYVLRSSYQR